MLNYGYIPSERDIRDYKINKESKEIFPDSFSLDIKTIFNQGSVCSCVAHATSSLVESIFCVPFSPGWIYGNRNWGNTGHGMTIPDALKTVQKLGAVKKKDFDVNEEVPDIFNLVEANRYRLEPLAELYKIGAYARLNDDDDIKRALLKGLPIIFAIDVRDDDLSMNEEYVINITNGRVRCGHAMVLYGWNEKGWLIQNSWGTEWGNHGTAILPYEYGIDEAFAISKNTNDIVKPNLYWLREIINFILKLIKELLKNAKNSR